MAGALPRLNSKYCCVLTIARSAGKFVRQLIADANGNAQVVVDPGTQHPDIELFARRRRRRQALRDGEKGRGTRPCLGSLEQHPEQAGIDVGEARPRIRSGGGENSLRARLIRQVAFDEIIDAAQRGVGLTGDRVTQKVPLHAWMIPEARPPSTAAMARRPHWLGGHTGWAVR